MAPLRLAIVTPRFWPLVGDRPTHLHRLADSLIELGHQPIVVTPQWKRSWPEQMMIGSLPLVRLRGSGRGGWSTLRWMYSLATWLRHQPLDAAIVDGLRHEAYVALGAARHTELRVVLIAGDDDLTWQKSAALGSRIAHRCQKARILTAPSEAIASALVAVGFPSANVRFVRRPSPSMSFRTTALREAARAALANVNADLVVGAKTTIALAMGRLDTAHQFSDLVRAWRIVTAKCPESRLWIVGDGPERDRLYRQIGDLDQRFRILIPGTFDCLEDLIQASDMLLVPSQHLIPPVALLDAQAAGLPVIVAQSPMTRDCVTSGETGSIYAFADIEALAACVLDLIEHPARGIQLGAAARAVAATRPTPLDEARQYFDIVNHWPQSG